MTEILTISLNPAIDLSTTVDQVVAGPKLRCTTPRTDPGGGGVNVARTICKFGGDVTALIAVGGATGDKLLGLLADERLITHPVRVSGETRQSFAVMDESNSAQFRFSVPGEPLTVDESNLLVAEIAAAAPQDGLVVLSGRATPGLPVDFTARIRAAIEPRTDKLVVDTSGPALAGLIARPTSPLHVLRVDQNEAEEASGRSMKSVADSLRFAQDLIARGVARIVVTGRGSEGSILATCDQRYFCHPPVVPVRSKIGAGDAFVGSMTLALSRDEPLGVALQWGVAAASATVQTEGTALCGLGWA